MTRLEFQNKYSGELNAFFKSECGNAFLTVLSGLRIPTELPKEEHLLIENRGAVRGYELCLRMALALSLPAPSTQEAQANYGVPSNPENPTV